MGFIDRLGIARKDSQAARLIVSALLGVNDPIWMQVRPETLAKEGYKQNVWVYACINGTARTIKGIPWTAMRPEGRGGSRAMRDVNHHYGIESRHRIQHYLKRGQLTEVETHPALKLLARPNPEMGGGQFIEAVVGFWLISGQSYIEAAGPKVGPPKELWPARPDRIRILPDAKGRIAKYRYSMGTEYVDFDPSEMLMHKFFNPLDDWYGMSPIEAAARAVDRDNASEAWNMSMLQNGGRPAGAMVSEQTLDAGQKGDLRKAIKDRVEGAKNAGRILLLDGGLKWQDMGLSPRDMDWIQGQQWSMKRVAAAFGYPLPLLDPEASATYANYGEARKALIEDTCFPLMDHMRDDWNGWLMPKYSETGDVLLAYKPDEVEALQEDRNEAWQRTNDNRLTVDERREAVGLDPLPGGKGNVMMVPTTMSITPVDEFGAPPEPPEPISVPDEGVDPGDDPATAQPDDEGAPPKKGREVRAFNLGTQEQRAAYHEGFERVRAAWEREFEKRALTRFLAEKVYVQKMTAGAGDSAALRQVVHDLPSAQWTALYRAMLAAIVEDFGERTLEGLTGKGVDALLERKASGEPTWWSEGAQQWVEQVAAKRVGHVTDATKKVLQGVISEGIAEGWSIDHIRQEMVAAYDKMSAMRATLIARTEVIGASNSGAMLAAKQTGLKLRKTWLATLDGRTRPDHMTADGQEVEMHEAFSVGGYQGQYPGDPELPASEVCNCRCTVTFTTT